METGRKACCVYRKAGRLEENIYVFLFNSRIFYECT